MALDLTVEEQKQLTQFSKKLQSARANDLESHTNSLTEDTYQIDSGMWNSIFYWPDGHDGPVEDLPYLKQLSPTEKQLIETIESTSPYTYLAHGVGRITFTIDTKPEYIVKFGRWGLEIIMGNGVQVNQSEHRFYTHTDDILDDSPLLPILEIGDYNGWVIQRKVITYEDYDTPNKPEFETVLTEIDKRLGPFADLITDKSPNNIGYVDGNWYLFDYGQRL